MRGFMGRFGVSALAGLVLLAAVAGADDKEKAGKKVPLDKVPRKVMDAVKARFPGARITSVEKETADGKVMYDIELTQKGRELKAVCDAMGQWGARWLEIEPHHQDPAYVLWATTKLVNADMLPDRTVVVRFELTDRPGDRYWMLLRKPTPELCTRGTGYVEDIIARTDAACLIDIHLRRISFSQAQLAGRLLLEGPRQLTDAFMTWLRPSPYAAADRHRRLAR